MLKKVRLKSLNLFLLIFLTSCVFNSRYTNPDAKLEEQIIENPRKEEEIRQYKRDFENYQAYKNITENIGYRYQVTSEEKSKWSVGNPDALIHLGNIEYRYHHQIRLLLICGENTFTAKKLRNKIVNWKISDRIAGETATSLNGELKITFTNDHGARYDKINITTSKNTYTSSLGGHLFIEINEDECD